MGSSASAWLEAGSWSQVMNGAEGTSIYDVLEEQKSSSPHRRQSGPKSAQPVPAWVIFQMLYISAFNLASCFCFIFIFSMLSRTQPTMEGGAFRHTQSAFIFVLVLAR